MATSARNPPDRSFKMRSLRRTTMAASPSDAVRLQAIELLFGLDQSYEKDWPGILVVFNYLEMEFQILLQDNFNIIWKVLDREKPIEARGCWHWCFAVLQAFLSLQVNKSVSMENVYKHLINGRPIRLTAPEKDSILLAIFAVLCWTSKMLTPALEPEQTGIMETAPCLSFHLKGLSKVEPSQTSLESTARRPVTKLFGILKSLIEDLECIGIMSATADTDTIHESSVNIFSLYTIGRVKVKWVEDLTFHLAFDRPSRTLSVFCFPTFCVGNILRTREIKIIQQISSELLPSIYYMDHSDQDMSSLHREVLLTYRLLFGQSSHSRALATTLLEQHKKESSQGVDPFLSTICTVSNSRSRFLGPSVNSEMPDDLFPTTMLDINKQLIEPATYSSRNDFPHFGPRLLSLQQYNLRQQPSRVRDLWRDRRNPLQWYTFWAVLWVGGITIVLASLQLVVGLIQVSYAVPRGKDGED